MLKARARQVAHEQARFLATMVAVALCDPADRGDGDSVVRLDEPSPWAADEVRAALVWTRRAAESRLWDAYDLLSRLPQVHQALDAGRIDLPRARVFAEWTDQLTQVQAERVCRALLPVAPRLTTGQLIARIRQMAIAIDPAWAERKYREAVRTRRVVGYRNPDGTANVSGLDLPVDRAAAACSRIDALARRAKRAGDRRPIDMIRADLYLGMLDGTYERLDERQIIGHLLTNTGTGTEPHEDTDRDAPDCDAPGQDESKRDDPDQDESMRSEPDRDESKRSEPTCGAPDDHAPDDDAPGHGGAERGEPHGGEAGGDAAHHDRRCDDEMPHRGGRSGDPHTGVAAGVDLHVKLSTLLGLDEHPAEIAGWAFTHAEVARAIAARQTGARWRYAVCDDDGILLADGLITRRPSCYPPRKKCGGAVEVQVPLTLLRRLAADPGPHPAWAAVIDQINTDCAAQIEPGDRASGNDSRTRPPGSSEPDRPQPGADVGGRRGGDAPGRRFPGARLRRQVQARDRTCVFPGCRMPARAADIDHTRQWQHHGHTLRDNLGSLCRHDHRLKDEGGWSLRRTESGLLRWTSPLGLLYEMTPPPIIIPLPDPEPRPQHRPPPWSPARQAAMDQPIWFEPRLKPPAEDISRTPPRPPPGPENEIPPF